MSARRSIVAAAVALSLGFCVVPYLWFAAASLKTPVEIAATPPTLWPSGTLAPYRAAIVDHQLARYVTNSAIVGMATTALALLVATPAGYALARLDPRGGRLVLGMILAAAMVPQIATAGPIWQGLRAVGLVGTRAGLVIPHVALALPLAVWLLATFFETLPTHLEDAALVDGCSRIGTLRRVILPLAAPGAFTAAILVLILSWNEFFFALLVLSDPATQTLPLGIATFAGRYTLPWGEIAAASVLATAPILLVVLVLQRRIAQGLVAGAVKG